MDDTAAPSDYASGSEESLASDIGASLTGIALFAASLLLIDGVADDVSIGSLGGAVTVTSLGVAVAAIAAGAFFARRYDVLDRRLAAPIAAVASLAAVGVGGYALVSGTPTADLAFGLSILDISSFGVIVGGIGGVLAAVADWLAISDDRLTSMTRTTVVSSGVGFLGYLALNVASLLVYLVLWLTVWSEMTAMRQQLVGALGLGIGTGVTALAYIRLSDREIDFLDLRVPSARDVGLAVLGIVVIFGGLIGLSYALQLIGVPSSSHSTVEQARQGNADILLLLIPVSFLIIGPGEELLFRNIVQKSMYDAFSRPTAIVVASLVFASVHIPAYGGFTPGVIGSLATIFTLSLVLGAFYALSDNVLVPAFIHGTLNAVQFALLYVEISGYAPGLIV
ncbi:type II CAAX endopeptidase family protein [Halostella sp. PRR32]|uniref:CPBP family intramembrane glutamic endopeptidase n=1 Tax=Halostella sp. PRR32 TaxID=3098147 RepID=UPI002B1D53FA|nr:type II CAAX endopeptidase family protein [Halostella sp. PRR32]